MRARPRSRQVVSIDAFEFDLDAPADGTGGRGFVEAEDRVIAVDCPPNVGNGRPSRRADQNPTPARAGAGRDEAACAKAGGGCDGCGRDWCRRRQPSRRNCGGRRAPRRGSLERGPPPQTACWSASPSDRATRVAWSGGLMGRGCPDDRGPRAVRGERRGLLCATRRGPHRQVRPRRARANERRPQLLLRPRRANGPSSLSSVSRRTSAYGRRCWRWRSLSRIHASRRSSSAPRDPSRSSRICGRSKSPNR